MPARSADAAEHRVVIHRPQRAAVEPRIEHAPVRLIGPIQLEQDTGLALPLCALVYSYLSDGEREAMRNSASPYGRDIEALRQYRPAPALGGVRVQGLGAPGPLVAFAWQAREEVRAGVTRGALAEVLNQRDRLRGQARQAEDWQDHEERLYICCGGGSDIRVNLVGKVLDTVLAGLTFEAARATPSPTLHAAGAITAARILGHVAFALTEIKCAAWRQPDSTLRYVPVPNKVKLCAATAHAIGAWVAFALLGIVADKNEDSKDLYLLFVLAGFVAVGTLLEQLIRARIAVADTYRRAAPELYRRAEAASVLGQRDGADRHALVYLDRYERIAVDVGAQPFVAAPFLSHFATTEGLDHDQLRVRRHALELREAMAQGRSIDEIRICNAQFRNALRRYRENGAPHNADRPGERALETLVRDVDATLIAFNQNRAFMLANGHVEPAPTSRQLEVLRELGLQ